jgi:hypothetical protein
LSEAEPLSLVSPVKPKIPALRSARHDPQLNACAAGIRYVVACPAGLQPSNRIRSDATALGFDMMPPALPYAECLDCVAKRCNLMHVGP